MKTFARWLYMKYYEHELILIARYAKRSCSSLPPEDGLVRIGEITGALDTLTTLDLIVR